MIFQNFIVLIKILTPYIINPILFLFDFQSIK